MITDLDALSIDRKRRRLIAFVRICAIIGSIWIAVWSIAFVFQAAVLIFLALVAAILSLSPLQFQKQFLDGLHASGQDTRAIVSNVGMILLGVVFGVVFLRYLKGRRDVSRRLRGLAPASPPLDGAMKQSLSVAATMLGVPLDDLSIYLSSPQDSTSAYTMRIRGRNYLVVSPGLCLRIVRGEPVATAIAAHEMAHFQQRDCEYSAIVSRFLYQGLVVSVFFLPLYCLQMRDHFWIGLTAILIFGVPMWVGQLYLTRRLRHSSELAADLAAALCGYPANLIRALESVSVLRKWSIRAGLIDFHPDPVERLISAREAEKALRELDKSAAGFDPDRRLTPPHLRDYLVEGSRLAAWGLTLAFLYIIAFLMMSSIIEGTYV